MSSTFDPTATHYGAPPQRGGFSTTNLSITRKLVLAFSAIVIVSLVVGGMMMRALSQLEAASAELEVASRVLSTVGKAEALHLDRSNIARTYLLNLREDVAKRYHETSKNVDKTITEAVNLPIDDKAVIAAVENFRAMTENWRNEVGDPMVRLAGNQATYAEGRERGSSVRASEVQATVRKAVAETHGRNCSTLDRTQG